MANDIDPRDQLQIGDTVVLKPWGIVTTVEAYCWLEKFGHDAMLVGYRLSCGVDAPRDKIDRVMAVDLPACLRGAL